MRLNRKLFVTVLVLLSASISIAQAATEVGGQENGAFYRIVVPDNWNGSLVIWGRGLNLNPLPETPDLGPLAPVQLSEGYAVAASSYSQQGWSLFRTDRDYRTLLKVFRQHFRKPDSIIVSGGSLGGLVAAQSLERIRRKNIDGAYALCGPLAGSRNWDTGVDLRLVYDYVCADVPGAAIPGGAEGLPANNMLTETELALAVNACTGILAPPALRTIEQSSRLQRILDESTIPESFFLTVMQYATQILSDLVHDPEKLNGRIGVGNRFVTYDDADINQGIERVTANFWSALKLYFNFTPRGRIRDTKVVSLHTDKDGLVFVENQAEYSSLVPDRKLTTAIVVEDAPSHCGFNEAEAVAGWEELRTWIAGDAQPSAMDIQSTCQLAELAGLAVGPCRFDPEYDVADYSSRTPSRLPRH